ncbi:MAG: methylmalonyl-CoA mutase family protein [Marmoricola sp.]
MDSLALQTGAEASQSDWEKSAAAVLRKSGRIAEDQADSVVWEKLARRTLDGIEISPLGTPGLLADLVTVGRPTRVGSWDVRASYAETDSASARNAILTDLENGVTSLWLELGAHGLPVSELAAALQGVLLDIAPVVLDAPREELAAAQAFAAIARGTVLAPGTNLGADPIGAHIRGYGGVDMSAVAPVAALATELGCRALVADGSALHDRGASDVQELGYTLAVATSYLRFLVGAGYSVDDAAGLIELRLAATDEQFPTIGKFRAVRRLWARVLELSGASVRESAVHAVTSRPMMTKYDPWVNMLRTCVASFAAGVGGADAVTVLPFDAELGLPDAFSRRIARNTSALLIDESHVAKVTDPAGGSYMVEKLTDDLAVAGWAEFGELDIAGGLSESGGALRERVAAISAERAAQVAKRKRPITGISEFPNLHESLPERRPYAEGRPTVAAYGQAFEALRDEPMAEPVFLATMGTVAAHTARATFASNLFAAGGIDVVNEGRHDDIDAVLAHYRGERVVCLTGTDAAYAEWGDALAAALREGGAQHVIVAGKPMDSADDNCAMGLDALDFLHRTREKLS